MTFAWPWVLALIALPAAWLVRELRRKAAQTSRTRPHLLEAEARPGGVALTPGASAQARPRVLLVCGVALAIVALARPQWGVARRAELSQSREILIGLDLSRSMLTPDVKPSRLARSKLLIRSLLDRLAGERVGLEVFAGTAFLQAPMSADYEILREFLPHLSPAYLPVGGTDYGALIDTAADAFGPGEADRYLILLSDGGATDEGWQKHVPELTRKGIRVIALGVGTEAGGFIPDGSGGFVKDERGAVVLARLDSSSLRELAARTGGVYRDAGEWVDLPQLLRSTIEAGRKGVFVDRERVIKVERYQWALAPALLLLLLSFWKEFPVRLKARDVRLRAAAGAACAVLLLGQAARAASSAAPPPPPGKLLGRIADRLANGPASPTAQDWAEFADETRNWGEELRSAKQDVPKGPVEDGLGAVDQGRRLDAHAADWDRLAADLRALLVRPPPPPPKKQKQQRQNRQSPEQRQQQERQQQQDQQRIGGGNPNRASDPARANPALSGAMQKLDEVRSQDSPAELFELIAKKNPHPPQPQTGGKDW